MLSLLFFLTIPLGRIRFFGFVAAVRGLAVRFAV
jgi:hypothetical protein